MMMNDAFDDTKRLAIISSLYEIEPRAFIGIPIVILILFFIMKPEIKTYFHK
jgi:hypothetical protein